MEKKFTKRFSKGDNLGDLYRESSQLLCYVISGHSTVKNALYSGSYVSDIRKIYAIVMETLKRQIPLKEVLIEAKLWENCDEIHSRGEGCANCQLLVQAYDVLIGSKQVRRDLSECPLAAKKDVLINAQAAVIQRKGVMTAGKLYAVEKVVVLPKYARINILLTTKEETLQYLSDLGLELIEYHQDTESYDDYLRRVTSLKIHQFLVDYHMEDLLVFANKAEFQNDQFYLSRKLLLQDKGSCIPAKVLLDGYSGDGDVLDACAAPGNKTTQLYGYMKSLCSSSTEQRTLFAFDRNKDRYSTMCHMLGESGCVENDDSPVSLVNTRGDFLMVDANAQEYANVKYILLDPSCSGSGIIRHVDRYLQNKESISDERLRSLSNLQATLLKHALTFPNVERVVYSTCSIFEEENESVVKENLERVQEYFKLRKIWIDTWPSRGCGAGMEACLRTDPNYDLTGGFFVACFERRHPGDFSDMSVEDVTSKDQIVPEEGQLTKKKRKKKTKKNNKNKAKKPKKKKKKVKKHKSVENGLKMNSDMRKEEDVSKQINLDIDDKMNESNELRIRLEDKNQENIISEKDNSKKKKKKNNKESILCDATKSIIEDPLTNSFTSPQKDTEECDDDSMRESKQNSRKRKRDNRASLEESSDIRDVNESCEEATITKKKKKRKRVESNSLEV